MKAATLLVCGCCAFASGDALARTFSFPHVLETSGSLRVGTVTGTVSGPFNMLGSGESIGPGENGEFTYVYGSPLISQFTDSLGRSGALTFDIIFCQSRPEGSEFRFEMFVDPIWSSFNGEPLNAHGGLWEFSVLTPEPDPLGSLELIFQTPPLHFAAEDGSGRTMSLDAGAGTLRLVPAPISAALLGLGAMLKGLFRTRKVGA